MASVITQSIKAETDKFKVIAFACTAHTDGTFDAVTTDTYITKFIRNTYLYKFQVTLGATAPTADSDFTLKDSLGVDLLGGQGTNAIPATGTKEDYPKIDDLGANQPVLSALTLAISNNSVNAATFTIYVYFKKAA